MYHPSRGGVRGGRDQFNWDDVKVDKHRENYLGHSIKAPVGRWQKGKDLHWYSKDRDEVKAAEDAAKVEIGRIKEEEEQAMREALGLEPVRKRPQGSKLDKLETQELFKRGKTAEDLTPNFAEAERVKGFGFEPAPGQKNILARDGTFETTRQQPGFIRVGATVGRIVADAAPAITEKKKDTSTEITKSSSSKEEKRIAKEKRKEEKRAAKLARKEERKQHRHSEQNNKKRSSSRRDDADDDDEDSPSRSNKKHRRRRHDSDSE